MAKTASNEDNTYVQIKVFCDCHDDDEPYVTGAYCRNDLEDVRRAVGTLLDDERPQLMKKLEAGRNDAGVIHAGMFGEGM